MSVDGWMAATFDYDDMRGVYVVGDAEALRPYLPSGDLPEATDVTPVLKPDPLLVDSRPPWQPPSSEQRLACAGE